jgi:hypothetical protein
MDEKEKKKLVGHEEKTPKITDMTDYYLIESGGDYSRTVSLSKEKYRQIRSLYCGPKSEHLTINQMCRKLDIPRQDMILIKTAFKFTHDDVPFIDEDVMEKSPDELAEMSLEKRKENFFLKLNEIEYRNMQIELAKYRKQDYFTDKLIDSNQEFFTDLRSRYQLPQIKKFNSTAYNNMLEVSIVDLHLAKLSWAPETGQNYDRRIAEERFMFVINDVLEQTQHLRFDKIIFPIGNDFFNFDTVDGKTTGGTRQDNDSRLHKMFLVGAELLIKAIDILSQVAPVYAFLVPGNHDTMTSFYATHSIYCWFHDNPNVSIDFNPSTRKYVEYGNNLIGFSHLNREKKRIFGNMQVEQPQAWGRTKFREWHGAHLHSEQVKEDFGIKVRNLTSVTADDAWHNGEGYVGSIACSQTFIWHKEKGLKNILFSTVEA